MRVAVAIAVSAFRDCGSIRSYGANDCSSRGNGDRGTWLQPRQRGE